MERANQVTTTIPTGASEVLTDFDLHLFKEGTHYRLYEKLGAHPTTQEGQNGTWFAVWAPNARYVSVVGDFNGWNLEAHPLSPYGNSGVWARFVPGAGVGAAYQYHLVSRPQGGQGDKTDPMGFRHGLVRNQASYVWDLLYEWQDAEWMANRAGRNNLNAPMSIYEVELGSWMRVPEQGNRPLSWREAGPKLAEYALRLGFTHVELMPVMQHSSTEAEPYNLSGFFAPDSRFGGPQDLMYLVDCLHQAGIGVILDWVPTHFPSRGPGLAYFDGTHLYEYGSRELQIARDGSGYIFDYRRPEVRSFLISTACFWLEKYHADGLRVDALGALLYLDFGRQPREWVPNRHGGRENLEGIDFVRQLNAEVYRQFPDVQMIARESSTWPMVSRPTYAGGLGFGLKWDPNAILDLLAYFGYDPLLRKFHHDLLLRRAGQAFSENFVLPLSHLPRRGEASVLSRMAGDEWQKFANLRLLLGYLWLQPGKKLLFMGNEFGQWQPWNRAASLDWHLCASPLNQGMQSWVKDLNRLYTTQSATGSTDTMESGFEWIDTHDAEQSTLSWLRRDLQHREAILVVGNFTPVVRRNFRVGVPCGGWWREVLNSDAKEYGGSGQGNLGGAGSSPFSSHGRPHTLTVSLPPLALVAFKHEGACE